MNADGELITQTPVTLKVHPEAVTVYVSGANRSESGTSGGT